MWAFGKNWNIINDLGSNNISAIMKTTKLCNNKDLPKCTTEFILSNRAKVVYVLDNKLYILPSNHLLIHYFLHAHMRNIYVKGAAGALSQDVSQKWKTHMCIRSIMREDVAQEGHGKTNDVKLPPLLDPGYTVKLWFSS